MLNIGVKGELTLYCCEGIGMWKVFVCAIFKKKKHTHRWFGEY